MLKATRDHSHTKPLQMQKSDPPLPLMVSAFSSKKELKQTRHRLSLYRSADIGTLGPVLLYPGHHHYLRAKNDLQQQVQENNLFSNDKNYFFSFGTQRNCKDVNLLRENTKKPVANLPAEVLPWVGAVLQVGEGSFL